MIIYINRSFHQLLISRCPSRGELDVLHFDWLKVDIDAFDWFMNHILIGYGLMLDIEPHFDWSKLSWRYFIGEFHIKT